MAVTVTLARCLLGDSPELDFRPLFTYKPENTGGRARSKVILT